MDNAQQIAAPGTISTPSRMPRLPMLDGWRGLSILAVLACHMLPLGPARFQLNVAAGTLGMAIFFTLSGFLITSTLFFHPSVRTFAIRRLFRIVPVAWLFMLFVFPFVHASDAMWHANLFFYANIPPFYLASTAAHLWSLSVEVQFYLGIGLFFLLLRQRAFVFLPFFCLGVTFLRVAHGMNESIVTLYRVDEILSGATLAYLFHSRHAATLKRALARINPAIPLALLCLSAHPSFGWLEYARPYFAAATVGTTLFHRGTRWSRVLESKPLAYIATISYALYIWHPVTTHGWFESGTKLVKYAKRPLGIALSFLMAHFSTLYFEKFWIDLGKSLTTPRSKSTVPTHAPAASAAV